MCEQWVSKALALPGSSPVEPGAFRDTCPELIVSDSSGGPDNATSAVLGVQTCSRGRCVQYPCWKQSFSRRLAVLVPSSCAEWGPLLPEMGDGFCYGCVCMEWWEWTLGMQRVKRRIWRPGRNSWGHWSHTGDGRNRTGGAATLLWPQQTLVRQSRINALF